MRSEEDIKRKLKEVQDNYAISSKQEFIDLSKIEILKWVLGGSQWISVNDRLPENGQIVLVYYGYINLIETSYVGYFNYGDTHLSWIFDRQSQMRTHAVKKSTITHWMSLPSSPEVNK